MRGGAADAPVFIEAKEELAEELGIPLGSRVRLWKAVYSFCRATGVFGIAGTHARDFLIAESGSKRWEEVEKKLLRAFRWAPREEGHFKQTWLAV